MVLKMINKIVAIAIIFTLVLEQSGFAQVAGPMGIPAYINGYISPDKFRPLQLRSLTFDQITNDFNLFLDKGDLRDLKPKEIKENAAKLSEYFRIGLRLPNSTFWVNLRPDAQDQMIDPWLEKTDLGKVMLEADLQLKKDMANFTSPQTAEGKNYWDNLYKKAEELFGQSEIIIPTLTRPWIVPGEILIRQTKENAYIYKATLNVMLEQDYLKDAPEYKFDDPRLKTLNEYSSELIRREILPKLTREVNSSKNYAGLRQVYYSLVLAQWFKQSHTLQDTNHKIDSFDLSGLTSKKNWSKETYFKAYKKSFAKGEYKLQETVSRLSGTTVRQYFSGGEKIAIPLLGPSNFVNAVVAGDVIQNPLPDSLRGPLIEVTADMVKETGVQHPEKSNGAQSVKKDGGSAVAGNGSMFNKMLPGLALTAAGLGLGIVSGAALFGLLSIPFFYVFYGGLAGLSFIVGGVLFIQGGYKAAARERAGVWNWQEAETSSLGGGKTEARASYESRRNELFKELSGFNKKVFSDDKAKAALVKRDQMKTAIKGKMKTTGEYAGFRVDLMFRANTMRNITIPMLLTGVFLLTLWSPLWINLPFLFMMAGSYEYLSFKKDDARRVEKSVQEIDEELSTYYFVEPNLFVYNRDGGTAVTLNGRVKELYAAINEITWMASPNEDFVAKRLARVRSMIKENKYTPEEIRIVKEHLQFTNLIVERDKRVRINLLFSSVSGVLAGGLIIASQIFSGVSQWLMVPVIGMIALIGGIGAYNLYKLFTRDIPLRDLNSEYYNEVDKMLTEANQEGKSAPEAGKNALITGMSSRDGGSEMKNIIKKAWWGIALPVSLVSTFALFGVLLVTWFPYVVSTGITGLVQGYMLGIPALFTTFVGIGIGHLVGEYAEKQLFKKHFDNIDAEKIKIQQFPEKTNRDGGSKAVSLKEKDDFNFDQRLPENVDWERLPISWAAERSVSNFGPMFLGVFAVSAAAAVAMAGLPVIVSIGAFGVLAVPAMVWFFKNMDTRYRVNINDYAQALEIRKAHKEIISFQRNWARDKKNYAFAAKTNEENRGWKVLRVEYQLDQKMKGTLEGTIEGMFAGLLAGSFSGSFSGTMAGDIVPQLYNESSFLVLAKGDKTIRVICPSLNTIKNSLESIQTRFNNNYPIYSYSWWAANEMLDPQHESISNFLKSDIFNPSLVHDELSLMIANTPDLQSRPDITVSGVTLKDKIILGTDISYNGKPYLLFPKDVVQQLSESLGNIPTVRIESGKSSNKELSSGRKQLLKDGGTKQAANKEELNFWERLLNPVLVSHYIKQLENWSSSGEETAIQLGRLGDKRAIKPLEAYIIRNLERDQDVHNWVAEQSLRQLGVTPTDVEKIYLHQLDHKLWFVKARAAERLGQIGGELSRQALSIKAAALNTKIDKMDTYVQRAFSSAAEEIKSRNAVSTGSKDGGSATIEVQSFANWIKWLERELKETDPVRRLKAAKQLQWIASKNGQEDPLFIAPVMIAALNDRSADVQRVVIKTLGILKSKDAVIPLVSFAINSATQDIDLRLRMDAISVLGGLGDNRAVPGLIKMLEEDHQPEVRVYAAEALGQIKAEGSIDNLLKVMYSSNEPEFVRKAAENALVRFNGYQKAGSEIAAKKDGGTAQPPVNTGGVDFRVLPAVVQPMVNPAAGMNPANMISLRDLDKQWSEIQSKIYQGEMPYQEIKKYASACCGQEDAAKQLEQVSEGITNILKMEEDRALPTAPELKEILAYLG